MTIPPPADPWLNTLGEYNFRLADRLNFLGLRIQQLNGDVPSALASAVEELGTAAEELRVSQEELHAQTAALADAQSEVEQSRRRYQELFDLAPDAYLVTDAAGIIQEANQATSALVGYARTYVLGKPLTALLDPSAIADFANRLTALRQTTYDRAQTIELQLRARYNGPPIQASVRVAPVRTAVGGVVGFRWLLRDVTEARATAAALARLEATQAQILRTRTMELEALLRMKEEAHALDQAALQRLAHDTIQALQHGAEPGPLLAHVLNNIQPQPGGLPATEATTLLGD